MDDQPSALEPKITGGLQELIGLEYYRPPKEREVAGYHHGLSTAKKHGLGPATTALRPDSLAVGGDPAEKFITSKVDRPAMPYGELLEGLERPGRGTRKCASSCSKVIGERWRVPNQEIDILNSGSQ